MFNIFIINKKIFKNLISNSLSNFESHVISNPEQKEKPKEKEKRDIIEQTRTEISDLRTDLEWNLDNNKILDYRSMNEEFNNLNYNQKIKLQREVWTFPDWIFWSNTFNKIQEYIKNNYENWEIPSLESIINDIYSWVEFSEKWENIWDTDEWLLDWNIEQNALMVWQKLAEFARNTSPRDNNKNWCWRNVWDALRAFSRKTWIILEAWNLNWHWYMWWDVLARRPDFIEITNQYNVIDNPPPPWSIISYQRNNFDKLRSNYWHVEIALWNWQYYFWQKVNHPWWYNNPEIRRRLQSGEIVAKIFLPTWEKI